MYIYNHIYNRIHIYIYIYNIQVKRIITVYISLLRGVPGRPLWRPVGLHVAQVAASHEISPYRVSR